MARTIVDIPDALLREVDSVCRLLGVSRAEAVRRALRVYVRNNGSVKADGFGLWASCSEVPDPITSTRAPSSRS